MLLADVNSDTDTTVQHTASYCDVMQHTATYGNTLQHRSDGYAGSGCELGYRPHCNTLQHTATHCNTRQHTATHGNTLQHTATHGNTPQHTATLCNTLQHTATHGNTRQHTATHCNTGVMDMLVADANWDTDTTHEDALIMNTFFYKVQSCWSVLECVAVHCSALQMLCSRTLSFIRCSHDGVCCSVLQCIAVCCSVL